MTPLLEYPRSAALGRVVPKTRIYEHAGVEAALRDLFVEQVDQIIWRYKLAPETVNLRATHSVPEIQIFEVALRTGALNEGVLRAIDRAIPFPLIFELTYTGKRKVMAAYKRPSEGASDRWVISDFFTTEWVSDDAPREPLPVAVHLGALYDRILTSIMPVPMTAYEDIQSRVDRMAAIRAKEREVERIKVRLAREKQFNKRVAINAELRNTKQELERLIAGHSGAGMTND
ncbi:MAG: DUF4391 domain-containing protein [Dehalococcoidia bacterium]